MAEITKTFLKDQFISHYPVSEKHHGMRLDNFVLLYWKTLSREFIKKKIKDGEIIIEGRPGKIRPSMRLQKGDNVTIVSNKKQSSEENETWKGEEIPLILTPEIVFEDENIIIINKPPFMATHPVGRHLFYTATTIISDIIKAPTYSIHRLDRETSGALILGKNSQASMKVSSEFENKRVRKCYFLISKKKLDKIDFPLTANERLEKKDGEDDRVVMRSYPEGATLGKHATTYFEELYQNDEYVVALAFPITGRQHQIRVHAMIHGFPLIGDKIYYGGYEMFQRFKDDVPLESDFDYMQIPRHALHAIAVNFYYFKENQNITIKVPFPEDLLKWLNDNLPENDIKKMQSNINQLIQRYFIQKE